MRRVIGLADEFGAPSAQAFSWMILAEGLDPYGAYARAEEAAQRALTIARAIDHREWILAAYGPIGRVRRARGDLAGALTAHQEMLATARDVGSAIWTTEALANVARDRLTLGDLEAARVASDEAIEAGDRFQKCKLEAWLTRTHLLLLDGRPEDALREARATHALISEFRVRLPEIVVLEGAALAALGRADEAETAYRAALDLAGAVGAPVGLWQAARALDGLLTGLGRAEEAAALRATVDAQLDALAVDLAEPDLRRTLAAQRWPEARQIG